MKGEVFNLKYTVPMVKHGGRNVMLDRCFSVNGAGNRVKVDGIMRKEHCMKISRQSVN